MKIELKLSSETISIVAKVLEILTRNSERAPFKMARVYLSICFDLLDKFETKKRGLMRNRDIFNSNKKHKMTLKFYEAWALEAVLVDFYWEGLDDYNKMLLKNVRDTLNQKIA